MAPIAYARFQFPPTVIQDAVWLYPRFNLPPAWFRGPVSGARSPSELWADPAMGHPFRSSRCQAPWGQAP